MTSGKNVSLVVSLPCSQTKLTKIKDRFEGKIPYGILTYGDIISFITTVGIDLCTDLKLKKQLKSDSASKYGLGTFCQDFGFANLSSPFSKKHRKKSYKSHRKSKPRKESSKKESYKSSRKTRRKSSKNKDVCWTCGKTGHRAKDCRSGNKNKLNQLGLSEETKEKIFSIVEDSSDSSYTSSSSSDDYSDEEFINTAYESD
ncbi:uncharacterized protein LOC107874285 [Capsicum annuum]|uniref:uncharacterized protein LOC107874285 n=1 Tax=Capsicum annuum TaxID=4072 RepID=UPI0007BFA9BE|nr:uncharacterized protein LOC107874285 [Capsicum annuum]